MEGHLDKNPEMLIVYVQQFQGIEYKPPPIRNLYPQGFSHHAAQLGRKAV
jgi:hypothetical protein